MDSNTSTIRDMLGTGDVRSILDTLGTDRREDFTVADLMGGPDGQITLALVGRAMVTIMPDGTAQVSVHQHDASRDDECWQGAVAQANEMVADHNAMAARVAEQPAARMLIAMGAPAEAIEAFLNDAPVPHPARGVAPVPMPTVSLDAEDGVPGFYL